MCSASTNFRRPAACLHTEDRKSTRLNSSHGYISYAVFCLKKKFTAGEYRVSLGLWRVASFITLAIALAVVGAWLGDLIQRFDADGSRKLALQKRIRRAFAEFQQQLQSSGSPLAQDEISSTFALFTDIQTYMDQRSYAFAHRLLAIVEARLRGPL